MPKTKSQPQTEEISEKQPGDDENLKDELTVLQAIREFKREATQARRPRILRNRMNNLAYLGLQDWSHKQKGQSKEFIPKVPMAVEQFVGFIKRALIAYGDWFSVEVGTGDDSPLTPEELRRLMICKLNALSEAEPGRLDFPTLIGDGMKMASLSSLCILKVHGRRVTDRRHVVERGLEFMKMKGGSALIHKQELKRKEFSRWELLIDLINPYDYYPDPTGRKLYEIHEIERDLSQVIEWAEAGIYDKEAVAQIEADFAQVEDRMRREREKGQWLASPPTFRKRVVLWEFWGNLLGPDGKIIHRNVLATVANDKYLIRKPTPNPFWHNESPFVVSPLIRVPFSVWHKALMDHPTDLNLAYNELFNLSLDGGLSSVWGIKQLRAGYLEDARQVTDGIPQAVTLTVKDEMPAGVKVVETVSEGKVPPEAMGMMNLLDKTFDISALTSELKQGLLPTKEVKATEIIQSQESQAVTIDSVVRDVEKLLIEPLLRKSFLNLLQHAEDLEAESVVASIGRRTALVLSRMSPEERYATFAHTCQFKVFGLSATLAKARESQKLMALTAMVNQNPLLLQAFVKRFSADKLLTQHLRSLNIDPTLIQKTPEEMQQTPQQMQELPMFNQLTGNQKGQQGGAVRGGPGGSPMQSSINQAAEPTGGF